MVARFVDDLAPLVDRAIPHGIIKRARIGEDCVVVRPVGWTARGYRRSRLCKRRETGRREQRNARNRKGEAAAPDSRGLWIWCAVATAAARDPIMLRNTT
jgi:hypothetical protein